MVQKILKQEKELAELRFEVKQLKITRTQDEMRMRDLQVRERLACIWS